MFSTKVVGLLEFYNFAVEKFCYRCNKYGSRAVPTLGGMPT